MERKNLETIKIRRGISDLYFHLGLPRTLYWMRISTFTIPNTGLPAKTNANPNFVYKDFGVFCISVSQEKNIHKLDNLWIIYGLKDKQTFFRFCIRMRTCTNPNSIFTTTIKFHGIKYILLVY